MRIYLGLHFETALVTRWPLKPGGTLVNFKYNLQPTLVVFTKTCANITSYFYRSLESARYYTYSFLLLAEV